MSRPRSTRFLARLVLAWFVFALGIAAATPAVRGDGPQLVCTGGMVKLLDPGSERAAPALGLDCPLCSPAVVPPPANVAAALLSMGATAPAAREIANAPRRMAQAPQARGPPEART